MVSRVMASVKLKDILRPLKEALSKKGIVCTTWNETVGSSFTIVHFDMGIMKDAMVMKIDCRDLTGHEIELRNQMFNALLFIDANYLYLTREEIGFLEDLFAAPSFTLRFDGDIQDIAYGLEGVNALTLRKVEGSWEATLTIRGQVVIEQILTVNI